MMRHAARVRATQIGLVAALIVLWEILARGAGLGTLLPPPSAVLREMPALFGDGALDRALLATLFELATAFALSVILGAAIGYVLAMSARIERIGLPILLLAYAVPQITILPLFVLWFGLGMACKIAFGVTHGIFPVLLATHAGLRQARPHYARWSISLGATRWQMVRRVLLPQAVPAMCTGMRLSMSMCLLGVLLAEIYVSALGVGFYVRLFTDSMQGEKLFGLIFTLAALAIILNALVRAAERRTAGWQG